MAFQIGKWNQSLWNVDKWAGQPLKLEPLQNQSALKVFKKIEIRRRTSTGYEANWQDVSRDVSALPTISQELDTLNPFTFRRGSADISFRNNNRRYSSQVYSDSIFNGYISRFKTLFRIRTGLEDENGLQYPSTAVFHGFATDNIIDSEYETEFTVNDLSEILAEFPASNIAPSITGLTLTANEILGTIRDYTDTKGNVVVGDILSSGAWKITQTGRYYLFQTSTELDGQSALDLVNTLALAENSVFYIDNDANFVFRPRGATSTAGYTFRGLGRRNINIASIDEFSEGIDKIFTKFTLTLTNGASVFTQSAFTVGDQSPADIYGEREYSLSNNLVTTDTAGSICSDLLKEFSNPKKEIALTTKYITQIDLGERVKVENFGDTGGDGSEWGAFLWGAGQWSDYKATLFVDGDYNVIGKEIDLDRGVTRFKLREI